MELTLITDGKIQRYVITPEQAEILQGGDDLAAYDVFRHVTGKDINYFVCVERGKWEVD